MKLTKYLEAVRSDIGFEILKNVPTEFVDAVRMAKNIEIALNSNFQAKLKTLQIKAKTNYMKNSLTYHKIRIRKLKS